MRKLIRRRGSWAVLNFLVFTIVIPALIYSISALAWVYGWFWLMDGDFWIAFLLFFAGFVTLRLGLHLGKSV